MSHFSFLHLPAEIRNEIYQHLLIIPPVSQPRLLGDPPLHPAILLTNRKIHSEALQILYGQNTFLAHPNLLTDLPRLRLYYDTISSQSLISLIRRYHIRIRLDCDPNFVVEKASEAFSGLDELTIEVFQAQFGSSNYKTLRLFEGVRGVRRVRIYGSVTAFPGYVEWLERVMVTQEGDDVELFDKEKIGDGEVKSYDIWTVSLAGQAGFATKLICLQHGGR